MFAELYCGMALAFTGCLTGGIDCFAESVVKVENDGNEILSSRCYKLSDNCAGLKNVRFMISDEYYCGTDIIRSSAVDVELKISDFNEQSYFSVICISDKNQQGKIK